MNRTRRAVLCAVLVFVPLGSALGARADDGGGASVGDDQPTQPAPWRWACTHPQAWMTGVAYVDGGRVCEPEDLMKLRPSSISGIPVTFPGDPTTK